MQDAGICWGGHAVVCSSALLISTRNAVLTDLPELFFSAPCMSAWQSLPFDPLTLADYRAITGPGPFDRFDSFCSSIPALHLGLRPWECLSP